MTSHLVTSHVPVLINNHFDVPVCITDLTQISTWARFLAVFFFFLHVLKSFGLEKDICSELLLFPFSFGSRLLMNNSLM